MKTAPLRLSRRELLIGAAAASHVGAGVVDVSRYETPYKYGKLVLAAEPDPKTFDSRSVDCSFVFHHQGALYMTYVGWDGTGYQTGLATSADLVHWRKLGCILPRDPNSQVMRYNAAMTWILRDPALNSRGELKKVSGRYLAVYHAYPRPGYEEGPAVIGLCWSRDLRKWEVDEPCLRPEDGADWERGGLYKACLVEKGGTYYLFYNAKTPPLPKREGGGWHEQTGVATSTDLKKWTRCNWNAIVCNGPGGSPDFRFASDPLRPDRWHAMGSFLFRPRRQRKSSRPGGGGSGSVSSDERRSRPRRCWAARRRRLDLRSQTFDRFERRRAVSLLLRRVGQVAE